LYKVDLLVSFIKTAGYILLFALISVIIITIFNFPYLLWEVSIKLTTDELAKRLKNIAEDFEELQNIPLHELDKSQLELMAEIMNTIIIPENEPQSYELNMLKLCIEQNIDRLQRS
jgi:hypothetical protein